MGRERRQKVKAKGEYKSKKPTQPAHPKATIAKVPRCPGEKREKFYKKNPLIIQLQSRIV